MNNNEVIEVQAEEISNNPLDKKIEQELVKANVTEMVIAELTKKYGSLRLKSIDDKESYLELKAARKEVRKIGILTEECCENGRASAVKEQRLWLAKQKEVLAKIALVQDPIDADIKRFDDEEARLDAIKKESEKERLIKRQSSLIKLGASYVGGSYTLDHISYDASNIQEADDEFFEGIILPKYQKQFDINQAEVVTAENKRKEEADKLKKEREDLENQQAEMKRQQEELKKQQDDLARQKQVEQDRAAQVERERKEAMINARGNQLRGLGMTFDFVNDGYTFYDVNVDNKTEVCLLGVEEWNTLVEKITPVIADRKKEAEEAALAKIEKEKQNAIEAAATKERERVAEVERLAELKKQQEAEDLAKASDKEKLAAYVKAIKDVPVPAFKSKTYKDKIQVITNTISAL